MGAGEAWARTTRMRPCPTCAHLSPPPAACRCRGTGVLPEVSNALDAEALLDAARQALAYLDSVRPSGGASRARWREAVEPLRAVLRDLDHEQRVEDAWHARLADPTAPPVIARGTLPAAPAPRASNDRRDDGLAGFRATLLYRLLPEHDLDGKGAPWEALLRAVTDVMSEDEMAHALQELVRSGLVLEPALGRFRRA